MTTFHLQNVSPSTWAITQGRKRVGTVNRCPNGWVARLGKHCEVAGTYERAFRAVTAKQFGFESPEALVARNREIAAQNRQIRAERDARLAPIKEGLRRGDYKPLMDALDKAIGIA